MRVIEFDGEYWHESGVRANKERDVIRDRILSENGYVVLHVKEKDYKENKMRVIEKCMNFITK